MRLDAVRGPRGPRAARYTFLRGEAIYDDGKIAVRDGFGKQAMRASEKVGART